MNSRLTVAIALLALYFIWGSTFLGMKFAIESFPPFMMAGLRFSFAGLILYAFLRWRGVSNPSPEQWKSAAIVGFLLLAFGNAGVAYAEQWIATGNAAMMIATVPLWIVVFDWHRGNRPHRLELWGIALGVAGVLILNRGANLQSSPLGALCLLSAALAWSYGSVWSRRLDMPQGAMSSATQMLVAGAVLMVVSVLAGERVTHPPTPRAVYAMIYLVVFGSFIAYSAYLFLLDNVRPALATSYAFVNPLVAMGLGVWLAGEQIGQTEVLAMSVILAGVLLVMMPKATISDSARR